MRIVNRPTIAQVAARDTRIETVIREKGPCPLSTITNDTRVQEVADYNQVISSTKRLHALGRIHVSGPARQRTYSINPTVAKLATATVREPKLGDFVWFMEGHTLRYGYLTSRTEHLSHGLSFLVEYGVERWTTTEVTLDGHKLIAKIEAAEGERK